LAQVSHGHSHRLALAAAPQAAFAAGQVMHKNCSGHEHGKHVKPMDGPGDPSKVDAVLRNEMLKEKRLQANQKYSWMQSDDLEDAAPVYFRVPRKGDSVEFSGLRSRPNLNGIRGEVLTSSPDASGLVDVRVAGGMRKMRVHPGRLRPVSSSPVLPSLAPSPWAKRSTDVQESGSCITIAAPGSALGMEELRALQTYFGPSGVSNTGLSIPPLPRTPSQISPELR
jgi:hypothetical protein